ncbi:MAG: helix-turn-helix transcriptional regulator [Bacteroidota bacterium]
MTPIAKEVGHRIRKIREAKDLNQQNMADKLEITAGAYAKIERGETDPSITRLFQIAAILKTDLINLIKEPAPAHATIQLSELAKDMEFLKKEVAAIKKSGAKKK